MSFRWHSNDCNNPIVVAEAETGNLRCSSCSRTSPTPESLRDSSVGSNPLPTIPPDEPLGSLNLSWPSSTYYTYSNDTRSGHDRAISADQQTETINPPKPVASDIVYNQSLQQDEIRLLHLSPSPSPSLLHPFIHIRLGVYPDKPCPEYEAISYTWADEDGDFRLQCPIYVGPFWDILLVTNNCLSMLFYTRRSLVPRVLWVDAICVHQTSQVEKTIQIPKMGAIYNNAMRVVVFLDDGGNIDKDIHPDLRPRQSIMSPAAREALPSMQSHPYFTRLWIIQELVLARSVVFAFQGVEYQADAVSASRDLWSSGPASKAAPWLSLICQQSFSAEGGLAAALLLTGQSKCGDIRDKLFGILGLLGDDHEDLSLGADYTISSLHVLVGTFTHCVIQKRMVDHVLRNAVGKDGWGKQPSWVPAWRT
ncbi:Heterokaryon incompatibility protein (HET) domain containing protein, partial [Rhypophila decipiens]